MKPQGACALVLLGGALGGQAAVAQPGCAGWRICDIEYGPGRATLRQTLGGRAGCR